MPTARTCTPEGDALHLTCFVESSARIMWRSDFRTCNIAIEKDVTVMMEFLFCFLM